MVVVITREKVASLARRSLEIEENSDETVPDWYLTSFSAHLSKAPNDFNFIVEFAKPGKGSGVGGNGYGIATCLEDECWTDVRLGPDPGQDDGGRSHGFGCLWEYQMHCQDASHIKGRTERMVRSSITYAPYNPYAPPAAQAPAPAAPRERANAVAGPSRGSSGMEYLETIAPRTSSTSSATSSKATRSVPTSRIISAATLPPHFDSGPSAGARAATHDIKPIINPSSRASIPQNRASASSSSKRSAATQDGDVEILSQVPEHMRKVTNEASPYELSDTDDEVEELPSSSAPSRPSQGSQAKRPLFRSGSGLTAGNENAFQMMMQERDPRVKVERQSGPSQSLAPDVSTSSRSSTSAAASGPSMPASVGYDQALLASATQAELDAAFVATWARRYLLLFQESGQGTQAIQRSSAVFSSQHLATLRNRTALLMEKLGVKEAPYPEPNAELQEAAIEIYNLALKNVALSTKYAADHIRAARAVPQVQAAARYNASAGPSRLGGFGGLGATQVKSEASSSLGRLLSGGVNLPPLGERKPNVGAFAAGMDLGMDNQPGAYAYPFPAYNAPATAAGVAIQHGINCTCVEDPADCDKDDEEDDPYARYRYELERPRDLQQFFSESFSDFNDDATIEDAMRKLGMANMDAKFADMTVNLLPHQILGVAFMLDKERTARYRGGLLCDAMGLGKTVQTIAVMAGNLSEDRKCKTTLIVAPLAVLEQWKNEIESKTAAGLFKVMIYHGQNRQKSRNALKNADVVLTTYGTLTAESGIETKEVKKKKDRRTRGYSGEESEVEYTQARAAGPLFRVKYWRVVLDEAHIIRNRNTRGSKAVHALNAINRWSLTGTLINNSLSDVFPHLRFLGISPQQEWKTFNNTIAKSAKKRPMAATKRVQAILKPIMMRRHKESMLNGKRLLELPKKTSEVVELDFSEEERVIYDAVENRMKLRFGQFLKQGTVLKHLSCVLTMLVRLRQLTCHPWLLRRNPGDPVHENDFQIPDDDMFAATNVEMFDGIADLERALADPSLGQAFVDSVATTLRERYDRLLHSDELDEDEAKDGECSICLDVFDGEVVTKCKHSFCGTCINEVFENPPRDGMNDLTDAEMGRGARKCPLCRSVIEKGSTFAATAFFDPEREKEAEKEKEGDVKPDIGADRKGKRKSLGDDDDDDDFDVKPTAKMLKAKGKAKAEPEDEVTLPDDILPSTKMQRMIELLEQYLAEPGIKVIIFSEFVAYIDLCAAFLDRRGIDHREYTGKMRHKEREEVLREFQRATDGDGPRVLLISRKAGGAGLNLTAASKVISLDLAWNAAAENQAVDRAHRIGQTKPVEVQRLVIRDTVEQRILDLQAKKQALSDGAMGEGGGGRLGRLTVGDLMRLFAYDAPEGDA